jgi:hypothetical protein
MTTPAATAKVTTHKPSGVWIERTLQPMQRLVDICIEPHRQITDALPLGTAPLEEDA